METRTKQRWVGILVLLAILAIFIPLLFHDKRPAVQPTASVTIPAKPIMQSEAHLQASISGSRPIAAIPEPSVSPKKAVTAPRPMARRTPAFSAPAALKALGNQPEAWVVQLGAFGSEKNAKQLIKQLRNKGLDAYSRPLTDAKDHHLIRVFVGPEIHKDTAEALLKQLKVSFHLKGVLRHYRTQS